MFKRLLEFLKSYFNFPFMYQVNQVEPEIIPISMPKTEAQIIYEKAREYIGTDASPADMAPDEFGCAESVSDVLIAAGSDFHVCLSTKELYEVISRSTLWKAVQTGNGEAMVPGDLVFAVTGMGGRNGISHGHVGIVSQNGLLMSNNSKNGVWDEHFSIEKFIEYYNKQGGYPILCFHKN